MTPEKATRAGVGVKKEEKKLTIVVKVVSGVRKK